MRRYLYTLKDGSRVIGGFPSDVDWVKMRPLGDGESAGSDLPNIVSIDSRHYRDTQLPRNYEYHEQAGGKFDEDGACLFDSWEQVERTTKLANEHGEKLHYDAPFRSIR